MSGKSCSHALIFIVKLSRKVHMDNFVHDYFSIDRFRKEHACQFNPVTFKDQWSNVDLGQNQETQNEEETCETKRI